MKKYIMNQPLIPEIKDFEEKLKAIVDAQWLTNFGRLHHEFEAELGKFLGVPYILPVANATFGLLTALKALGIKGEVITTPFTFPATYHLLFNLTEITPVFVDISREDFCILPERVKDAITPETSAILAVHAYGFPAAVEELEKIAAQSNLRLIFDAAPCFGVRYKGRSITEFGEASVLSFHATKVFNTAEGGAIVCRTRELYEKCRLFINFGISGEESVELPGLNGKLDEFRAALGLLNLKEVPGAIQRRKRVVQHYLDFFSTSGLENVQVPMAVFNHPEITLNYTYFPVVIHPTDRMNRDVLYQSLKERGVFARKYYYPTVLDLPLYQKYLARYEDVSKAAYISKNVLCLPVNPFFEGHDCEFIADAISSTLSP